MDNQLGDHQEDDLALQLVSGRLQDLKVPTVHDRVYKDECMFCFATSESPGGLFINLQTLQAFDQEHILLDHQRTGTGLYLNEVARRVPLVVEKGQEDAQPEKLAIGVEGGFQLDKKTYEVEKDYAVVLVPEMLRVELPCPRLPEQVLAAIAAVQHHEGSHREEEVAAWQEERQVSKYAATLELLPCTRKVSSDPKQWKCDETGVTDNLWLNLGTGNIGSGRPHWDGSGGNGAAMRHYLETGKKYPLVVKLGTITPRGADVYSYASDEDDMVLDPKLGEHLAHWGINMLQMEKTEKTMAELQIEKNLAYEFDRITEAGSALHALHGPACVGLKNLGNSCYMNSVLQLLWRLPELKERYVAAADSIFSTAPADPSSDFLSQFAKVGIALVEGKTGAAKISGIATDYDAMTVTTEGGLEALDEVTGGTENSVKPLTFKSLVGKGHAEFSSSRQQDAQEYFSYLMDIMQRAEHSAGNRLVTDKSTAKLFQFQTEARIECMESGKVIYKEEGTMLLGLEIPVGAAINKDEIERNLKRQKLQGESGEQPSTEERIVPEVPFDACVSRFVADETIDDYYSAALGRRTQALRRNRFKTFPPYLMVQMKRYYSDVDWTPKKLEVLVDVPERLSLENFRGTGLQAGEELQPTTDEPKKETLEPDASIVAELMGMGFSENGSKRAALATRNAGSEAAMEWVFSHMEDPDFNDPIVPPGGGGGGGGEGPSADDVDPSSLVTITSMGFTDDQAKAALMACAGQVERAVDWLFSRTEDLDAAIASVMNPSSAAASADTSLSAMHDGSGEYELVGFVSHMGSNTACGHYVCHVKEKDRWVIFNDEKVAVSERPPIDLGYMYLFRRIGQ